MGPFWLGARLPAEGDQASWGAGLVPVEGGNPAGGWGGVLDPGQLEALRGLSHCSSTVGLEEEDCL